MSDLGQVAHKIADAIARIAEVDGPFTGPGNDQSVCECFVSIGGAEYRVSIALSEGQEP